MWGEEVREEARKEATKGWREGSIQLQREAASQLRMVPSMRYGGHGVYGVGVREAVRGTEREGERERESRREIRVQHIHQGMLEGMIKSGPRGGGRGACSCSGKRLASFAWYRSTSFTRKTHPPRITIGLL